MRVVTLLVLTIVVACALVLLQGGVAAQLTILSPAYMLEALERQGVYEALYGGAADFVVAEATGLSESDQIAAARALQEVINQRALEVLAAEALGQVRPFAMGQAEQVVVNTGEFKSLLIHELTWAGGSPEAVDRLREGLVDVPESLPLAGHVLPMPESWDAGVVFKVGVGVVAAVSMASLLGVFGLAGGAAGMVWLGAGATVASAAPVLALGPLQRWALARPELAATLERLPLNEAIRGELFVALGGVAGQVAGQSRLVFLVGLLAGLLLVTLGAWAVGRRRDGGVR